MSKVTNYVFGASLAATLVMGIMPTTTQAANRTLKAKDLEAKKRQLATDKTATTKVASVRRTGGCQTLSPSSLKEKASPYHSTISKAAQKYGVNANLVKAVITIESCFKPRARGSAGEKGLMQLMPGTARRFNIRNGYSTWQNIHGGSKYLGLLMDRYEGNLQRTVAAFNAGEGNISRTGKIPNQTYVGKVMHAYNKFTGVITDTTDPDLVPASVQIASKTLTDTVTPQKASYTLPTVSLNTKAAKTNPKNQWVKKAVAKPLVANALPWADKPVKAKKTI